MILFTGNDASRSDAWYATQQAKDDAGGMGSPTKFDAEEIVTDMSMEARVTAMHTREVSNIRTIYGGSWRNR